MSSRPELLTDLGDSINLLTRPRRNTEYLEHTLVRTITTRTGKTRARRTRERRAHTVTLPSLLDELRSATAPGSNGDSSIAAGGFESRPSAELEPLSVLREIDEDAGFWMRVFSIERDTLPEALQSLVSAPHDDAQLDRLAGQAARWVHRARVAVGHEPAPKTLSDPCVYCGRRNSLVISGDMRSAKCARCNTRWDTNTIGLLADMLRANQQHEVLALQPCWMPDCTKYGDHEEHEDGRGHSWRDSCPVPYDARVR